MNIYEIPNLLTVYLGCTGVHGVLVLVLRNGKQRTEQELTPSFAKTGLKTLCGEGLKFWEVIRRMDRTKCGDDLFWQRKEQIRFGYCNNILCKIIGYSCFTLVTARPITRHFHVGDKQEMPFSSRISLKMTVVTSQTVNASERNERLHSNLLPTDLPTKFQK